MQALSRRRAQSQLVVPRRTVGESMVLFMQVVQHLWHGVDEAACILLVKPMRNLGSVLLSSSGGLSKYYLNAECIVLDPQEETP